MFSHLAGITRKRVSNTLRTSDGKVSSELSKELPERSPNLLNMLSESSKSLYLEIKGKVQERVLDILQNIGGTYIIIFCTRVCGRD